MRPCRTCKTPYEPNPRRVDRGDYSCNACRAAANRAWRARRVEQGLSYFTPRSKRTEAQRAAERERDAERYRRRKAKPSEHRKMLARVWTRNLIRRGQLQRQPCEVCGAEPAEAHHDDYAKPREVRWLCPTHHRAHHAAERVAARA